MMVPQRLSLHAAMRTKVGVKAALKTLADPERAAFSPRFFKAGKGEYAEGDRFFGVTVPNQRKLARQFRDLPLHEVGKLLDDPIHECRLTGLLILTEQFRRADEAERQGIVDLYFEKMHRVNNWDLVDSSADKLLGAHLADKDRSALDELARSGDLWRQRIAMIATFHFIKQDEFVDALRIARSLLKHDHDLIQKAVGWMLREIGKRDKAVLEGFLAGRYRRMPRTMLRYAIERFPEAQRQRYLKGEA